MTEEALRFDYHRSVAPMMWVLVALVTGELLVVHFLLALWKPWVAGVVSVATLPCIVWLVWAIASFRSMPVLMDHEWLVMRAGRVREHRIPMNLVAGLRDVWTGQDLKERGVSNLALIAYPNVWIDLHEGVHGRRGPIRAVTHRLDDPAAFRMAFDALR